MSEPDWTKLRNYKREVLSRGTILRMRGEYPYENVVDFMVFDPCEPRRGLGLLVVTGYKAGLMVCTFPADTGTEKYPCCLSKQWWIDNWDKWGLECDIDTIYVADNYLAPVYPDL